MSSLPTSFPYGSASSAYSVRDAFISYRRSQYYASSSVQPFDLSSELSDDELQTSELAQPHVNDTLPERHAQQSQCRGDDSISLDTSAGECQRAVGILPLTCPNPRQLNFSSHHSDSDPACRMQMDSGGAQSSGRETTPLLKKAASFSSQPRSISVGHVDYKSLSLPEIHSGLSQSSPPASPGTVAEYNYGGKSTYGQTLFNCIAVLLGIGMLSEPLAFAYAGWFWGTVLIIFFGVVTCYTAKLLTREILLDPRLRSYTDIGRKAFGPKSSLLTNSLFCLELFSVSVVLVTLAADSLHGVWPAYSANTYKIFSVFVLVPTVFMPLSILSFTSLLGISSTLLIIAVIFIDGFSKPDSPGSFWSPARTSLSPGTPGEVGVAFGLLMAGFSGHVVIPSLARDMIDPSQFNHMANWAFTIATFIYAIIGYAGYLMFGSSVSDEISKDLLATPGYNVRLNQLAMWLLVVTPLSKFALSTRPLNIVLEYLLGLESITRPNSVEDGKGTISPKGHQLRNRIIVVIERVMVPVMSIVVSIAVPQFSSLMAFLGSFSAFVICVIGPISAKIAMTGRCQWHDAVLLGISTLMAVWGTFSAFWTG